MTAEQEPYILFITGASASGKTTLYKSLCADSELADTDFHDIDEDGVPPIGRGPWREFRVEQLFYNATKVYDRGQSTIICGITKPSEIIESRYYNTRYRVSFFLVEVTGKLIRERLLTRSKEQATEDTFDESFDGGRVEKTITDNFELQTLLHNSVSSLRHGHTLDVSELSRQEMHDQAKQVIQGLGRN